MIRDTFIEDRLPPPDAQPEFLFDLPELHYPERFNAAAELVDCHVAAGRGDQLAIINDVGRWTYADLKRLSDAIAYLLIHDEGLIPGNRVLLRGPNCTMLFAAWLGVLKAGGISVTTMPILRAGEIATIIDRAEVTHAIVDARYLADFETAAAPVRSVMTYDGDAGTGALEQRIAFVPPGFVAVLTARDDVALIAFTSGTTGKPKGCVHYHRDILAVADTFARHILKPECGDRFCSSAPIAFTFGLGALLIFPFRFGATSVTVEAPNPAGLTDAINRFGVTTLFTAPTAYKAILAASPQNKLASLKTCVSAGEHLPAATWQAWRDATGISLIDGIGATEMMHIFISASGDSIRPGSTGRAVPGFKACILDAENRPTQTGTGRLAVKGPTGCRYFDDARQSDYVINGWNVTGDSFRIDEDGYFWYVARSDDMIISSGYNIAAPEVENALYSHPAVGECAVVGALCAVRGMVVKAFVVVALGHVGSADLAVDIQDHVKRMIAPYKYPRAIEFVTALPKTATGKLQRHVLRVKPNR